MAYNRKIKVGKEVITSLKSMGMKEAVRYANSLVGTKGNAEIVEGGRRLYGSRIKADVVAPKYKSADSARSGSTKKATAPKYKSADSARSAAMAPKSTASTAKFKSADSARAAVARGVNASSRGGTAKQALSAMKTPPKATSADAARAAAVKRGVAASSRGGTAKQAYKAMKKK